MYTQSRDIEATKRFLGHQQLDTTAIYVAFSDTMVRDAVEDW
jgi:site-specific recombinase XerD